MDFLLLIAAAAVFAIGGIFMKWSEGATRLLPTIAFSCLFLLGAWLQAVAMRRTDLGVAYIVVLGLEAALAFLFSVFLMNEVTSMPRILAVCLILLGVVLLRRS
jgi:multidrug transporter EmrE-like cation transporter